MTLPRKTVFLSSTCYDLATARGRIEKWAEENRYRPLLSDRANFPIDPGQHRLDVCLAAARGSDLFVLVIAGRFGAPARRDPNISITWDEFRAATEGHGRILIFVDKRVWDERKRYKTDQSCALTVTKDPRVFGFLDEIQNHEHGYWMEMFSNEDDIIARLDNFRVLPGS